MNTYLFCDYKDNLRVKDLKRILENIDDDMVICVYRLTEHFPAKTIKQVKYNIYKLGSVIAQEDCLLIE